MRFQEIRGEGGDTMLTYALPIYQGGANAPPSSPPLNTTLLSINIFLHCIDTVHPFANTSLTCYKMDYEILQGTCAWL